MSRIPLFIMKRNLKYRLSLLRCSCYLGSLKWDRLMSFRLLTSGFTRASFMCRHGVIWSEAALQL